MKASRLRRVLLSLALLLPFLALRAGAASGPVSVVTAPHEGHGDNEHDGGLGDPNLLAPAALGATPCQGGFADVYPCRDVDLKSFVPLGELSPVPDDRGRGLWGWTDSQTGREYAIVPLATGTSFVDISDPASPRVLGYLPGATSRASNREVTVYQNHAFIVADGSAAEGHGIQIFDLTQLRSVERPPARFTATARFTGVGRVHTLFINTETGFAFANGSDQCSGAIYILDVRDPRRPRRAGCYIPFGEPRYVHDIQCVVYHGPDSRFAGRELCFASNVTNLLIVDVTDKGTPVIVSRTGYSGAAYTHQGWLTEDHRYFLMDDEGDEVSSRFKTRTYLWDLSDLVTPRQFASHSAATDAIDHNQYVRDGFVYQANYRAGLRILDLGGIGRGALNEVAWFDIVPEGDEAAFSGAWNVYPYFPSRNLIVSGIEQGLYILRWTKGPGANGNDGGPLPTVCRPGPERLCLVRGRYWVDATWRNPDDGSDVPARSIRGNDSAGYFHFGNPADVELAVRVYPEGDQFFVSWARLTDLPFSIRVVDTKAGTARQYGSNFGRCGGFSHFSPAGVRPVSDDAWNGKKGGGCKPGPNRLCLSRRRFQVELDWANQYDESSGKGRVAPISDIAGGFTYRDPKSLEFVLKVLDQGDRIDVLWGALNDLGYTLKLTDMATGATREWSSAGGSNCGGTETF